MKPEQTQILEEREYVQITVRLPRLLLENLRHEVCEPHGLNLNDCIKTAIILLLETE